MAMRQFDIPDIGTVSVYKRNSSRNLRISITGEGVRVSMPLYMSYGSALSFIEHRRDWILNHIESATASLVSGQRVGKDHEIRFVINFKIQKPVTRVHNGLIEVRHPATMPAESPLVQSAARTACIRALRSEAETVLPHRLRLLADKNEFHYKSVSIKQLKGRWGSCDQHQNIVLNLFLMQLPWQLIDYVLMHELVHTKHLDHSPEFWAEFLRVHPLAKTLRREMRQYQPRVIPRKA